MPPSPPEIKNEMATDNLIGELKRVTLLLESLNKDIQQNRHNLLLLVGLITSRIMIFAHLAEECGDLLQLNPKYFGFTLNLLKVGCKNINDSFGEKLDKFAQKFCNQPHFFKSIDLFAAKTELNAVLQLVFHILSGMEGCVNSIRREVIDYSAGNNTSEYHLKTDLLKCIDVLNNLILTSQNKYLPLPELQHILPLIEPIKSVTTTTTASTSPTLAVY